MYVLMAFIAVLEMIPVRSSHMHEDSMAENRATPELENSAESTSSEALPALAKQN